MKTEYFLSLINDREEEVARMGPFATRKEILEIRACLSVNMGMKLVQIEKTTSLEDNVDLEDFPLGTVLPDYD